jgi:hypothetical protein
MPIPAIQNLRWEKQMPIDLIRQMTEIETTWREDIENKKGNTIQLTGDEDVVIDFHNGWTWFNLNKPSCSDEANAMGHCGNGSSQRDETILSLRKHVMDDRWTPHLTFILDGNGQLGEMKGRANQKPVEKYHPFIIALLKTDIVQGIKGGGYMPENNFSLNDLPDEVKNALLAEKPMLADLNDLYYDWRFAKRDGSLTETLNMQFKNKVEASLAETTFESIDFEKETITIFDLSGAEFFRTFGSHTQLDYFNDLFEQDEILDMLDEYRFEDEDINPREIVADLKDRYFTRIFTALKDELSILYVYPVGLRWNEQTDRMSAVLYLGDYCSPDEYVADEANGDLLAVNYENGYDRDDNQDGQFDDISKLLWEFSKRNSHNEESKKEFVNSLLAMWKRLPSGSPTVHDPSQYSLDLS